MLRHKNERPAERQLADTPRSLRAGDNAERPQAAAATAGADSMTAAAEGRTARITARLKKTLRKKGVNIF
jgi:hypothetical protein